MVLFLIIVVLAVIVCLYFRNSQDEPKSTVDKSEIIKSADFQEALERAKIIKETFQAAAKKHCGRLNISIVDTDNTETIDWSSQKYNPLIYFRLYLGEGRTYEISTVKQGCDKETVNILVNLYINETFDKSVEEMEAIGLDVRDIVFDTEVVDITETVLFYKFLCPCGLKGTDRNIFIDELNKL